jgi:hypothetical protein
MKVYLAKDWTGVHVFADVPQLKQCGGLPPIWCGHKLKIFDETGSLAKDEIPRGQYIEREAWWSIVHRIK